MKKLKILNIFYILLFVSLFSSCDSKPIHRVWYGNDGMIIESKSHNNNSGYGKYYYEVRDDFGLILIRTNKDWNIGYTLQITNYKMKK
jgi:hypothetical protein